MRAKMEYVVLSGTMKKLTFVEISISTILKNITVSVTGQLLTFYIASNKTNEHTHARKSFIKALLKMLYIKLAAYEQTCM